MGIKTIIYILSAVYALASGAGIFRKTLVNPYQYIFLLIIAVYFVLYFYKKRTEFYQTIIGCVITNVVVQLTGGTHSVLFLAYFALLPVVAYKESFVHYWIVVTPLFVAELASMIIGHQIVIVQPAVFAATVLITGFVVKNYKESEVYLKRTLIKYESRDDFFRPADFEAKALTTLISSIDKHHGVERPLLYFVKFVHDLFRAYSTAFFAFSDNKLVLVQGFSNSQSFIHDAVIDVESGIYRQVIASRKSVLIQEFSQNPEELGYYEGELKVASVIIAPIILIDKVEGVCVVDRKDDKFTDNDKELFDDAVNTARLLLGMLRLYEDERFRAKSLDSIEAFAQKTHKVLDLQKILSDAIILFKDVFKCTDVSIAYIDELNNTGVILQSTQTKSNTTFSLDDGLVGRIASDKTYIIKEDLSEINVVIYKKGVKTRNRSFIGVPVLKDDSILAVVWCEDHKKKKFIEDDKKTLELLASHLGLVWQRVLFHEREKEMAARDGLTGLYNHRQFQEMLEKEIINNKEVVLILFDIDHFKNINDTYGHQAGDRVIKFLGNAILNTGIAARYGGEEFAIILPRCTLKKGVDQAVRIKDHLLKSNIPVNHDIIKITVSIGIAYYPDDAKTRVTLIEKADKALYLAKDLGRDRIILAKQLGKKQSGNITA